MKPEVPGMIGCATNLCVFGHPGGMATNGPCHCLDLIRPQSERLRITRNIQLLRQEIRRLREPAVEPPQGDKP